MVDDLRKSVEDLEPPTCEKCDVEMKWYHSQRLLAQPGGLRGLFRMDLAELVQVRGAGDAKSVRLKATFEQHSLGVEVSPPPMTRDPDRSTVAARAARYCGQNIPMKLTAIGSS